MMGAALARRIDAALHLGNGWMDNDHVPQSYRQRRLEDALKIMEHMEAWQFDQAMKIIDTIAQPRPDNGTEDQ